MKYLYNEQQDSIVNRICHINNIELNKLNVNDFTLDFNLDVLVNFKNTLLSLKDCRFLIIGDYDCDGICATSIIKRLLEHLHIENNYYIPSRSKEGYGINNSIVDTAINNNFDVILMLDNGIVANTQIKYAKDNGIKTLIIDHHEYSELPNCEAVLHPNLFPDKYADMCTGGLSALLALSFYEDDLFYVYGGLATLADMVSVLNYNRYLLKKMITILNTGKIYQINYLLGKNEVSYDSLAYNVIPKINAVSRLDEYYNVNLVVRYLLADEAYCMNNYGNIEQINNMRKDFTQKMSETAIKMVDDNKDHILLVSKEFKEGLCGLIANKLLGIYNKPVLILSEKDNELKGSGRSPSGINIYEYLKDLNIFTSYGGHNQAIGLSLNIENYDQLLNHFLNNPLKVDDDVKDVISIDSENIDMKLLEEIECLKPFGVDFKEPLFVLKDVNYKKKFIIAGKYPKFIIKDECDAISFNVSHVNKEFKDMIGYLKKDSYHKNKVSFTIEDLY